MLYFTSLFLLTAWRIEILDALFIPLLPVSTTYRPLLRYRADKDQYRRVTTGRKSSGDIDEAVLTDATSSDLEPTGQPNDKTHTQASNAITKSKKWKADNFERDYQLLQTALACSNSISNLQQLQRKYTLDYGFRRHPLFKDVLRSVCNVGGSTALLISCITAGAASLTECIPIWRKACLIFAKTVISMTTIHYWVVVMGLPLFLLAWAKSEEKTALPQSYKPHNNGLVQKLIGSFGPSALALDAYFENPRQQSNLPSFFYSLNDSVRLKRKGTTDFVMCLLEHWSSSVVVSFIWRILCAIHSHSVGTYRTHNVAMGRDFSADIGAQFLPTLSRLITRIGAAAALYQYPQLLFELRRRDQPRPLCRPTSIMQWVVHNMFSWLPFGISADLAILAHSTQRSELGSLSAGFVFSIIAPLCYLFAFTKLVRVSKSNDVSLSSATSFPEIDGITPKDSERAVNEKQQIKWRYQILWRTPQRIVQTLRIWLTVLVTNHTPLLNELDELKSIVRHDGFSTEGIQFNDQNRDQDELLAHKDEIIESLSLIFRDRDEALLNATNVRFMKHQESYDSKELDDVLGVAVQQTFGVGLSFDFEHFDAPEDEVSIHQLRARMAKSAIREKKTLDNVLSDELELLHRLRENVNVTGNNDSADREMKAAEAEVRNRYRTKVERIKSALMTMIPTNAESPDGMDKFDSPILIAEYVNISAPVERRDLKAAILEAPDSLAAIEEYTRRNFGDQAADAYRQEELAYRVKEREMMKNIRQQHNKSQDETTEERRHL